MVDRREERKLELAEAIGKAFGIIMVVLYFLLGTTFIFYVPDEKIPAQYATPFGIILFLYGFYRAYRYYKRYWAR